MRLSVNTAHGQGATTGHAPNQNDAETQSNLKVWRLFSVFGALVSLWFAGLSSSAAELKTVLFFGDSLTAGYEPKSRSYCAGL